jgi:GNAT superfamily N-acetyltransferase
VTRFPATEVPADANEFASLRPERALLVRADFTPPLAPLSEGAVLRRGSAVAAVATRCRLSTTSIAVAAEDDGARGAIVEALQAGDEAAIVVVSEAEPGLTMPGYRTTGEDAWLTLALADRAPSRTAAAAPPRPIDPADVGALEALEALYREVGVAYWHRAMLEYGHYTGVRDGGRLISAAGLHFALAEPGYAHVGNVATAAPARRRGFATACVGAILERLGASAFRTAGLFVNRRDPRLVDFYRRMGFAPRGAFRFLER